MKQVNEKDIKIIIPIVMPISKEVIGYYCLDKNDEYNVTKE